MHNPQQGYRKEAKGGNNFPKEDNICVLTYTWFIHHVAARRIFLFLYSDRTGNYGLHVSRFCGRAVFVWLLMSISNLLRIKKHKTQGF